MTPCCAGMHPHDALQPHQVVCGLHHVLAVMQGQFVLARREFRDQRLGPDARQFRPGVDVAEQRQHPVQLVDRIDIGLAVASAVQHVAGRDCILPSGPRSVFQKEEFQLEGAGGVKPLRRQGIDLRAAGRGAGRRSSGCRRGCRHRHQHLAARRGGVVKRRSTCRGSARRGGRRRPDPRSGRSREHPHRRCRDRGSKSADGARSCKRTKVHGAG